MQPMAVYAMEVLLFVLRNCHSVALTRVLEPHMDTLSILVTSVLYPCFCLLYYHFANAALLIFRVAGERVARLL